MPATPHTRRARHHPLAAPLLALATLAGCRDRAPAEARHHDAATATSTRSSIQRSLAAPLTGARWLRGGSERDTLFADPVSAVADSDNVYVLDAATRQVTALHTSDGSFAWITSDSLAAPPAGRPLHPTAIAAAPGSGVTLADPDHATIATLDRHGRVVRTTSIAGLTTVRSLCTLPDSGFLLAGADPAGALLRLSPRNGATERIPLPWPDLSARPALATQTWLASSPRAARCAVALILGRGFAIYDGTRFVARQPYVEPFDLPGVTTSVRHEDSATTVSRQSLGNDRVAVRDLAADDTHLVIAFDGETGHRARLLDFYDLATGRYLHTRLFPRRIQAIATNGHDLFVLFTRAGRPALAAIPLAPAAARDTTPGSTSSLTRR